MTTNIDFLNTMDNSFRMKSVQWLKETISSKKEITILDLRAKEAFDKDSIIGSINIPLKEISKRYNELDSSKPLISLCNGSVQSAYAIMFLYSMGFTEVYNLSGGFSSWKKFHEAEN